MKASDSETQSTEPENTVPPAETTATAETETTKGEAAEVTVEPTLEEQLAAAQAEVGAARERHLRAVADLENFRKRTVREKEELRSYAASRVIEELLPVFDNLGLGVAAAKAPNADMKTLLGGIEMVVTQFKTALEGNGLKQIDPKGGAFDPNLHEALSQQPSSEVPEGHVLNVIRVGYSLNGRLLRPASVVVSGGPAKAESDAPAPADKTVEAG